MSWEGGPSGSGRWRGAAALLLAILVGCAAPPPAVVLPAPIDPAPIDADEGDGDAPEPSRGVVGFLADRGLDLVDVASVRIAAGPGLLAHARVTPWIAAGAGMLGRPESWTGGFELRLYKLGWMLRGGGVWTERRAEIGLSKFYYCESEPIVIGGLLPDFVPESRGAWDVGAELHLALVGVAAEVRPDQLLDFLVGWFGFDPADDDG